MANLTNFVKFQEIDLEEEHDYLAWSDDHFSLLIRFNRFKEASPFGLGKNLFITSFAVNNVRYGKHGESFSSIQSVANFLLPDRIAYINSLPDGLTGEFKDSKIFSFKDCKLLVIQNSFREMFDYFDFKIMISKEITPDDIILR